MHTNKIANLKFKNFYNFIFLLFKKYFSMLLSYIIQEGKESQKEGLKAKQAFIKPLKYV